MWVHHISGSNFIKGMTKNDIQMATDLNYHKYMTIKNVNLNFNQSGYMWIIHRWISSWGMMKIHCAINVIDWFKFLQLFHSLSKHTITTSFIIRIPITTKIIYLFMYLFIEAWPGVPTSVRSVLPAAGELYRAPTVSSLFIYKLYKSNSIQLLPFNTRDPNQFARAGKRSTMGRNWTRIEPMLPASVLFRPSAVMFTGIQCCRVM